MKLPSRSALQDFGKFKLLTDNDSARLDWEFRIKAVLLGRANVEDKAPKINGVSRE